MPILDPEQNDSPMRFPYEYHRSYGKAIESCGPDGLVRYGEVLCERSGRMSVAEERAEAACYIANVDQLSATEARTAARLATRHSSAMSTWSPFSRVSGLKKADIR